MIRKTVKLIASNSSIIIKPYTIIELARLYDVDRRTFKGWIAPFAKEIGEKNGRYFSIPQVKLIFKNLDFPSLAA
jgi:hypothetical protein